jgi:hypothetical protein
MVCLRGMIVAGALVGTAALIGCGAGISTAAAKDSGPAVVTAAALKGVVMGGQQPVGGVTLQLYQAGSAGYGSAATALGGTTKTNAQGNFDLASYTCTAGSQVYLVGTGGMPTAVLTNNNLALMVGLGTCGGTYLNGFIDMNELTTVATVWALAPFMKGAALIGSSGGNAAGLADAFAAINQVVTTANGTVPGPTLPTGATLNATEIDTLGDILEQCINSGGGVAGDLSPCGNLFHLAPNAAGTVFPADTITAAMNMAQSPGRNVAGLNKLRSAQPVFEPSLDVNAPPNDWTIAITYTGGGLSAPTAIAMDASGNAWIANGGNASVTELNNAGAAVSGASGFTAGGLSGPSAIAIDASGNAWVTNAGNSTLTELSAGGATGTVFHGNGLSGPASVAIDGMGNIWVANAGTNAVSGFTSSGGVLAGSPFSGVGTSAPMSVAVTPK